MEAAWYIGARSAERWLRSMRPMYTGAFMRRAVDKTEYEREIALRQWSLIPAWSSSHVPTAPPRKGETKGKELARVFAASRKSRFVPAIRTAACQALEWPRVRQTAASRNARRSTTAC